jgi:hypothetical protein
MHNSMQNEFLRRVGERRNRLHWLAPLREREFAPSGGIKHVILG